MEDEAFNTLRHEIAEQLKAARIRCGLSQEALALAAEVDRTYVSQLERGIANPSLLILHRLAMVLRSKLSVSIASGAEVD